MGDCVCCIQRTPTSSSFTILKKKEKKKHLSGAASLPLKKEDETTQWEARLAATD